MVSGSFVRWLSLGVHVFLWLAIFLIVLFLTPELGTLIVAAASGIALLVYIPATIFLGARDANTSFCSAKGELGYLITQLVLTMVYAINSAIWSNSLFCRPGRTGAVIVHGKLVEAHYTGDDICGQIAAVTGMSFAHVLVIAAWIYLIASKARSSPGLSSKQAYRYPVHRLVKGGRYMSSLDGGDVRSFSKYGNGSGGTRLGSGIDLPPIVVPARSHEPFTTYDFADKAHGRNESQSGPYLYPGTHASDPFMDRRLSNSSISSIGSVRDPRNV